ncbi:tyrosine-type recombinase/integrase [Streptomyces gamaensis]|uniref:Tyrosine-type recombinase/integrase n=1 Tax=Streptomyces gamaensis TaxID=1763542 RepID=A0ABW0Z0H4_9ACTN
MPQADGRRAQLIAALQNGEQFDTEQGVPVSELRALNTVTWYQHALAYTVMKWPHIAAKHRASIADALSTASPALVRPGATGRPAPSALRTALYAWAFRLVLVTDKNGASVHVPRAEAEEPPTEIARALAWIAENSLPMTEAARPANIRRALDAISRRLDGNAAAENTTRRKRMILNNAFEYAIECEQLDVNPLKRVDWRPPDTDEEVDFRFVPGPKLAKALIQAVRDQGTRGEHLEAFFGCMYYAAMRPGEVAALKDTDLSLPDEEHADEWGEVILAESRPEVASGWTDDGLPYERRGLKRRARKATRPVPIPPELVWMLREHIRRHGLASDGRLFRAVRGGRVRSTEYCELWQTARETVLSPEELATPLADVPYKARHAGISLWIQAGVEPPEVARRAGHSLAVLYRVYAKILNGRQGHANRLIAEALRDPGDDSS